MWIRVSSSTVNLISCSVLDIRSSAVRRLTADLAKDRFVSNKTKKNSPHCGLPGLLVVGVADLQVNDLHPGPFFGQVLRGDEPVTG